MKKVSLFFTTPVRQKMESSDSFAAKLGVREAITLPTELLRAVVSDGLSEESAKEIAEGGWKYFHRAHSEFHHIQEAVRSSQRMEGTIGFDPNGNLLVDVRLFKKTEKQSFFSVHFSVNLETGRVAGLWYGNIKGY